MVKSVDLVDVDTVWNGLGRFGKYQVRQLIVCLFSVWSCGFHILSIVFVGYQPQFACKEIPGNTSMVTNSSVTMEFLKCSIKTITNISGETTVTEEECSNGWAYHDNGEFAKERSIITEWDLVCDKAGLTELSQTFIMFGQGVGGVIFASLADRYGRKRLHIISHVGLFLISLATAFMPNYAGFAVMRVLTGAFQNGTGLCVTILIVELFPKEVRGYMEVFNLLFWSTGIALVTPIAYIFRNMSWRYLQICLACLSSWSLIEWFFIDESLRWLIANGKVDRAKAQLQKACHVNKKEYEEIATKSGFRDFELAFSDEKDIKIELLEKNGDSVPKENGSTVASIPEEASMNPESAPPRYTVLDLLRSKRLLFASFIMWFAWIADSATYYGIMLISSSLAGNRFLNFFLGSIVEYPAALMEANMINRYGRKPTCIIFHCIAGTTLIIATILITAADDDNEGMLLASTVFTLIGKFGITGAFSTVALFSQEIYPTNLRNTGYGLASGAARIGGMVSPYARNLAEIALWAPGLIFAIMCAIVSILILWVPETYQYELPQTIEECEQWYKTNQSLCAGSCTRSRKPAKTDKTEL